ncbi:MAG: metalloenzyme [Anaerolineae bacterium]
MGLFFVFLDGVGLGPAGEENPFWRFPTPRLRRLLGEALVQEGIHQEANLLLWPLDAGLETPGLPQSATGQTSLFTGINAAALVGGHLPAFPSPRLQEVIATHSLLKRAVEQGCRATFANAYSSLYWQRVKTGELRHSASTLSNLAAGLPFRNEADVAQGQALFWDITHTFVRTWLPEVRQWEPEQAAEVLLGLGEQQDLVMFESFLTDLVGHRRLPLADEEVVAILDEFLGTLAEGLSPGDTLVVTSDHGNFEDTRTKTHTRNPVPLLAIGANCRAFRNLESILDVAGAILQALNGAGPEECFEWWRLISDAAKLERGQRLARGAGSHL